MGKQMASVSGELDVSPWDAILAEVRRSAYRVAWVDGHIDSDSGKLRALEAEDPVEPEDIAQNNQQIAVVGASLRAWLAEGRKERTHLAKVSKSAIDAGLAERYVRGVEAEAKMIAIVLDKAMTAAELTAGQREKAISALRSALVEVSAELHTRHSALGLPSGRLDPTSGKGRGPLGRLRRTESVLPGQSWCKMVKRVRKHAEHPDPYPTGIERVTCQSSLHR